MVLRYTCVHILHDTNINSLYNMSNQNAKNLKKASICMLYTTAYYS